MGPPDRPPRPLHLNHTPQFLITRPPSSTDTHHTSGCLCQNLKEGEYCVPRELGCLVGSLAKFASI